MKIYTRTGDTGATGLVGGVRVSKTDLRIQAIGTVDEANAVLGLAAFSINEPSVGSQILKIQAHLFEVGAELASPGANGAKHASLTKADSEFLESSIDEMTSKLAPLQNFILPGGSQSAAFLHQARATVRRAEREVLAVESVRPEVAIYLNRLSDWLFTAARYANFLGGIPDIPWNPRADKSKS